MTATGDLLVAEHRDVGQYGPYSFRFYLTPCCLADATGTEHGVACRACYLPLPDKFGGKPGELTEIFGDGIPIADFRASRPPALAGRLWLSGAQT